MGNFVPALRAYAVTAWARAGLIADAAPATLTLAGPATLALAGSTTLTSASPLAALALALAITAAKKSIDHFYLHSVVELFL